MRNDLDRTAQIVAAALARNNSGVHFASRNTVAPARRYASKTLVMAEIQVSLSAVVGNVHLAMLIRTHRARVNIQVRIELAQPDRIAARL